jgi:uncharacterized phage infection (PIP) family protein YhgE
MQKIILGVLAILAVAGWAAAYVYFTESREVADRLTSVEAERASVVAALDLARSDLQKQTDLAGRLEEIEKNLSAAEVRSDALTKEVQDKQFDLASTSAEIEAKNRELSQVERQLDGSTASLDAKKQEAELASQEVDRLRTKVAELAQAAEQMRSQTPAAAMAPSEAMASPATQPAESESQATDPQVRANRMFQVLDANGDGAIDELEFRLHSIKLLGIIDANADGFVTPDETQLPPERFSLFDQDGDGKISSLEFVEAFRILDRDSRGSITLEDYHYFIDSAAK